MISSFHCPDSPGRRCRWSCEGKGLRPLLPGLQPHLNFATFWPCYSQRESVCLRWLLAIRLLALQRRILDPWFHAQYRTCGEKVWGSGESNVHLVNPLFFILHCLDEAQHLPARWTDSEWLQGSLCALLRNGSLSYMHHQSLSLELAKESAFFRLQFFLN